MTWRSASILLGAVLVLDPQGLMAQKGREVGVHALATFADFDFAGGGAQLSYRPGGRARFTLAVTPGAIDGEFALRGETTGHFLLNPRSQKWGFYIGGGLAGLTGEVGEAYLLAVIGWEMRPGGASGVVLEGGIGGGARLLLGYRWRRLRR